MKTAVILLGMFVAFTAAEEESPIIRVLKHGVATCRESMKPSAETLKEVNGPIQTNNREAQCFRACIFKEAGLIRDAKLDMNRFTSLMQPFINNEDKFEKIVGVVMTCKKEAEVTDDECVVVNNYLKCAIPQIAD